MILITGASGNSGSEVLKQAAAAGLQIRAAYQSRDKAGGAGVSVPPGEWSSVSSPLCLRCRD
jgi:uncharacterized protein YbjT (DUF2867 family)